MKKENNAKNTIKTSIGGQALIEGIMMRGPKKTAMAVRKSDGTLTLEVSDTVNNASKIKKIPVVRGIFAFVDSMISGYKALMRSAELFLPTEEEAAAEEARIAAEKAAKKAKKRGKAGEAAADTVTEAAETAAEAVAEAAGTVTDAANAAADAAGAADDAEAATKAAETVAEAAESVADASTAAADLAAKADTAADAVTEAAAGAEEKKESAPVISEGGMTAVMIAGIVLGLALSLFLFKFIPETVYEWTVERLVGERTGYGWNLLRSFVTGIIKIAILVGYMAAVSCMKDIRRTFMYHGAEHKTIFCYEHGEELTVENVRRQKRFHPRCGTSFLVLSVLVSILFTMFIPSHLVANKLLNTLARTGISLLLLPFIMGVGYELIKLAGKHENTFTRILSAPGMWLQHITTREPEDDMIECAIAAVKEVIPEDGSDRIG